MNPNVVRQNWLSNHLVSTIRLGDPTVAAMDRIIGMMDENYDTSQYAYETMVFAAANGEVTSWTDLDKEHSQTEEDALSIHQRMVDKWS